MCFGSCCIIKGDQIEDMIAESIKVEGYQCSLFVNFEVIQTFIHYGEEDKEISYIFPNDYRICIYDTTFAIGDQIIKPQIKSQVNAKKICNEAVYQGNKNIRFKSSQFKLGIVPPKIECKVILKIAFSGHITNNKSFYIEFPLVVFTPSGSVGYLKYGKTNFSFKLQADSEKVSNITSNVSKSKFDKETKTFSIDNTINNNENEKTLIITFETKNELKSACLISPKESEKFDSCALFISPNISLSTKTSKEFIFFVDCSPTMIGVSIQKASECLLFFIKSLPSDSYFNVIRFGKKSQRFFDNSVLYNDENSERAVRFAQNIEPDLGIPDLISPLTEIFSEECLYGQRQIFIITDGNIRDKGNVLELISENSKYNRCFTIGIGEFCDTWFVEGMANASGGKSDFVQQGDSISDKIIPQLESSFIPSITSLEFRFEGRNKDPFEFSPYPLKCVHPTNSLIAFARREKYAKSKFKKKILVSGSLEKKSVKFHIDEIIQLDNVIEDKYGCSSGKNIGNAILPLFAFQQLQVLNAKKKLSVDDTLKACELSFDSGVLCKCTNYDGMTEIIISNMLIYKEDCLLTPTSTNEDVSNDQPAPNLQLNSVVSSECSFKSKNDSLIEEQQTNNNKQPQMLHEIMKSLHGNRSSINRQNISQNRMIMQPSNNRREDDNNNNNNDDDDDDDDDINESTNNFNLLRLTCLQRAAGYWDDLAEVQKITKINIDHIKKVKPKNKEIEESCVATIIAIVAMRVKSSNERNSWKMVEQKALNWLKNALPKVNIEDVISEIESSI